jgi:hypothetical protein
MPIILVVAIKIKQVIYPQRYHNHTHIRNKTVMVVFHDTVRTLPKKCLLSKISFGFMADRRMDGSTNRSHLHTKHLYFYLFFYYFSPS